MPGLEIGMKASRTQTITAEDVAAFAKITGDNNPVHLDDAYAKMTRFGRRIAHGIFGASIISAVLANDLPGPGTVYMRQSLDFKAPVYIGDTITATVEITNYRAQSRIATLKTTCANQQGTVVIDGEAVVMVARKT